MLSPSLYIPFKSDPSRFGLGSSNIAQVSNSGTKTVHILHPIPNGKVLLLLLLLLNLRHFVNRSTQRILFLTT